jgi:hypothetical protein
LNSCMAGDVGCYIFWQGDMNARSISYTFDMVKLAFYLISDFEPTLLPDYDLTFIIFEWMFPLSLPWPKICRNCCLSFLVIDCNSGWGFDVATDERYHQLDDDVFIFFLSFFTFRRYKLICISIRFNFLSC